MLNEVIENTERFIASVPKAKRKKYGQFFTNSTTAKYMNLDIWGKYMLHAMKQMN